VPISPAVDTRRGSDDAIARDLASIVGARLANPRETPATGTPVAGRRAPMAVPSTDAALVLALGSGRADALAEVFRRHGPSVFATAVCILRSRPLAEEVVQEVFTRLWVRPQSFDPGRGSLAAFLHAYAHNRAVDVVRAECSRRARDERSVQVLGDTYSLEEEAIGRDLGRCVREAMSVLPANERAAITLAYFAGHTYRDVAALLGEPEGTVKSRIRAGLRRMRTQLAEAGITP